MEYFSPEYIQLIIQFLPSFISLAIYRRKNNININEPISLMKFILLISLNCIIVGIVNFWAFISSWILCFLEKYRLFTTTFSIIAIFISIIYIISTIISIFKENIASLKSFKILTAIWIFFAIPYIFVISNTVFKVFFTKNSPTNIIFANNKSVNLLKLYIYSCIGVFLIEQIEKFFNKFYPNEKR